MAQKTLTVLPVDWCVEAAEMLERAKGCASVRDLQMQVFCGASLFKIIDDNGVTMGFYVLRLDHDAQGTEGVLVAGAGVDGFDLTANIVPIAEQQCKNCYSFRIHTARAGMAKKLARMGYSAAEMVLRKAL